MMIESQLKQITQKLIFGRCIIDQFKISADDKVNIYANPNFSSISILKASENNKDEEMKLKREENMSTIFENIYLLHANDCPMQVLNSSLENNSLELNFNEFKTSSALKLASIGMVQDKNDFMLLTKRNKNLSIFPRAWVFPGGKLDKGETFLDACLREIKEEVGIEIKYFNNKFYYRNSIVEILPLIAYESIYPNKISQGLPK